MEFLSKGNAEEKHRLIILTDMENEPDDSQTMVKLLMYSNEIDIEGLIAVTSIWLKDSVYPESIYDRVKAYGIVRDNLMKHASGWPTEEYLLSKVAGGQIGYGMEAVGDGKNTLGSELIIKAIDKDDPRPVWFAINAGANTLAQAIWDVRRTRSEEQVQKFISKIRVYDDSGQDNAGAWICNQFPEIFYMRSRCQVFALYGPRMGRGPDVFAPLSQYDWAEMHVRTKHGILGALYPQRVFIKDHTDNFMDGGGTTTWIGLVNKGLFVPEQISWGGWGGRLSWEKEQVPAGEGLVYTTEECYKPYLMYPQASDLSYECEDKNNVDMQKTSYTPSVFAPVWRWRSAYTNDFRARMDWCVTEQFQANHHPVIDFMGDKNRTVVRLLAKAGETLTLDASNSYDPDNKLRLAKPDYEEAIDFNWYVYPEAGTYESDITLENINESVLKFTVPEDASKKQIHIILEVTDRDIAPLTSYRRIVIDVE